MNRRLRVATWNVHGLRTGVDAAASAIRAEAVDVLLVQESGPRRRLRALGAALGMAVVADPFAFPRRRIRNAVLVGAPLEVRWHRLVRFESGSLLFPRGALIAGLGELTAVSLHLGLTGAERRRHAIQLLDILRETPGPLVVGGDLNAFPEDRAPAMIAADHADAWALAGEGGGATFPSHAPEGRIDFLFVGPGAQPMRVWTAGDMVSDHLMVVAGIDAG